MRTDVYRRKEWKIEKRTMETTGGEKENPTETQITREKTQKEDKKKRRKREYKNNSAVDTKKGENEMLTREETTFSPLHEVDTIDGDCEVMLTPRQGKLGEK
ncbi:hypothetical protein M8J77_001839 [Diaphorina citri]|nr:hypothetical protein M8J77_001839 [Diaphorina citri]